MARRIVLSILVLGACCSGIFCTSDPAPYPHPITEFPMADAQPAWSPDGTTIAVTWEGIPPVRRQGLYLIDTADWLVDTLLIEPEGHSMPNYSSPSWSPDGQWLAFATGAQIYKIKANGDSLTQLTHTSRQWFCDWSDSDSLIAYNITIGDSAGIWLMDTEGQNKRYVIRHGFAPCFNPGDSIFYKESIPPDYKWARMVLMNLIDSTTREVYRWEKGKPYTTYYYPSVSPDGRMIAVSIDVNIWTLSIEGKDVRQLTTDGGSYPNWSPDGNKIIYCKPDYDGGTLWIMDSDGSNKRQIERW